MCPYRSPLSSAAESSIEPLALRNCSICSIVVSRASFMLITILAMINPHLTSPAISFARAHSWVETRSSFRLIPRWTRQEVDKVSVNMPFYRGDKTKGWISFRTIDAMAVVSPYSALPDPGRGRMNTVRTLVHKGKLCPLPPTNPFVWICWSCLRSR